jgi:hypothetical protein
MFQETEEIHIREYFYVIRKWKWMVLAFCVVFAVFAAFKTGKHNTERQNHPFPFPDDIKIFANVYFFGFLKHVPQISKSKRSNQTANKNYYYL